MKVIFAGKKPITKDIVSFSFTPPKKPAHIAGQFIELYLPHPNKDNRGDKRWFTLSSSPTEEQLSITTRLAAENGSSFKEALQNLTPGQEVSMSSPMGDFVLPKDPSIPLIFVAGGIGCTPFHSITKYLIDSGEKRDIIMIYNAKSLDDIAFKDDFAFYNKKFYTVTGKRISASDILTIVGPTSQTRYFYLSGPEPMVEDLLDDLKKAGVNKKHIHTDFFPGYPA